LLEREVKRARMEGTTEGNLRRLQRINRYLMIAAVILAIIVVLLAVLVFG
jgi:hypothetical protein